MKAARRYHVRSNSIETTTICDLMANGTDLVFNSVQSLERFAATGFVDIGKRRRGMPTNMASNSS